jgi:hypothetical protein
LRWGKKLTLDKHDTRSSSQKKASSEDTALAAEHTETNTVVEVKERDVEDDGHNKVSLQTVPLRKIQVDI